MLSILNFEFVPTFENTPVGLLTIPGLFGTPLLFVTILLLFFLVGVLLIGVAQLLRRYFVDIYPFLFRIAMHWVRILVFMLYLFGLAHPRLG